MKSVTDTLKYKPDWPKAKERWVAFWDRQPTDRPCIDVRAGLNTEVPAPPRPPSTEGLWLDPDYVAEKSLREIETTYWGGEAVPASFHYLMMGWTLGCGPRMVFAENTIYHPALMSSIDETNKWDPGPNDPWRKKIEKVYQRVLDLAPGKFFVGYTGQLPVNDLFSLFRGVENLLMDLADDVGICRRRLQETLPRWIAATEYLRGLVQTRQPHDHVWSWPGLWSPEFVMMSQSDMSCMISETMFDEFVMPELNVIGERYGKVWYHVDGKGARRHVKRLLEQPYITAIQYVPSPDEPLNGPAHLDLYRQVQAAGRGLDLTVPAENVEFLIRHLRPEGLVLRTGAASPEAAEELLQNAVKWCGSHIHANI